MHRIIIAVVVGSLAIGGCKSEKEKAVERLAEQIEQNQKAAAERQRQEEIANRVMAAEKKKLEAEITADMAKVDAIDRRLSATKDEKERAAIQKELDEARAAFKRKYETKK